MSWKTVIVTLLLIGLISPLAFADDCNVLCHRWQLKNNLSEADYRDCRRACENRQKACQELFDILGEAKVKRDFDMVWRLSDDLGVKQSTRELFYLYVNGSDYAFLKIMRRCYRGEL